VFTNGEGSDRRRRVERHRQYVYGGHERIEGKDGVAEGKLKGLCRWTMKMDKERQDGWYCRWSV
jgi:hypothetical protein